MCIRDRYQAYLFGILLPQVSSLNSSSAADIIFMPFLLIITLVVVPFNFLASLLFSIWALIFNSPMLFSIPNLNPIYLFFGILAPFIILAFNKWFGEKSKRLDFSKTISMDKTKNLMQQTLRRYFGDVLALFYYIFTIL